MVEIKENQHTRALCEKLTFSCNLFRPADWLPFDTLNSEFLVKFQNTFFSFQKKCVSVKKLVILKCYIAVCFVTHTMCVNSLTIK
jgi:hypothetical protein